MLMFKIAFRNIFRQRRRSILTALTMMGGFLLSSMSIALNNGMYNDTIDKFTRNRTGHVQIHEETYLEKKSLYKTITNYDKVINDVKAIPEVASVTPRIFGGGLFSVGTKTAPGLIRGIDPKLEDETFSFNKQITEGTPLNVDSNSVLIGEGLAITLKAKVGDTLYILSQGADGSMANDMYRINGIINSGNQMNDKATLYMPLNQMQELFVLEGKVHELAVVATKKDMSRELSAKVNSVLTGNIKASPWQVFQESFYNAMKADKQGGYISLFVIIFIVSVGILNTVLMAVMERLREYGLLKAMGTKPTQVFGLIMYEMAFLSIMSICIGSIFALGINYWFAVEGIPLKEPITYGGMEFAEIYGEVKWDSTIIPGITVIISTLIVSILPAIKAARTEPAVTMRSH